MMVLGPGRWQERVEGFAAGTGDRLQAEAERADGERCGTHRAEQAVQRVRGLDGAGGGGGARVQGDHRGAVHPAGHVHDRRLHPVAAPA